jgi:DNA invertase Pin-like site-specific DNA recombinase
VEGLRFAFYWRVSTEDHQDPVTSRQWQLDRTVPTIDGSGRITAEFSDVGLTRSLSWAMRPGAAALLEALADPDRGFDAVVIGSYERAFFGNQFSLVAPLFAAAGVQLWLPEVGGPLDPEVDELDELMALLGILAKREVIRARARIRNAMTAQVARRAGMSGPSPVWLPTGGCRATPEQGRHPLGTAATEVRDPGPVRYRPVS